jgi:hypothetical protein
MCPPCEVKQTTRGGGAYRERGSCGALGDKEKAVVIISGGLEMGLIEFGLLTSSGAVGSLLVYGYQNWLK